MFYLSTKKCLRMSQNDKQIQENRISDYKSGPRSPCPRLLRREVGLTKSSLMGSTSAEPRKYFSRNVLCNWSAKADSQTAWIHIKNREGFNNCVGVSTRFMGVLWS